MKNFSLLILAICIVTACKKNKDTEPTASRLSKVTYKGGESTTQYDLYYDSQNRLDSIWIEDKYTGMNPVAAFYYKKFYYSDSSYEVNGEGYSTIAVNQQTPMTVEHLTIGINGQGLITYIKGNDPYYYTSDTFLKCVNTYNDKGQLIYVFSRDRGRNWASEGVRTPELVTMEYFYHWDNDNNDILSNFADYSNPKTWTFDLTKSAQAGDARSIQDILTYGRVLVTNKNIPNIAGYSYEYNSRGMITKLSTSSISYTYEYQ